MTVYVVGAGGYIGRSLLEYLGEREYDVRGIGRGTPLPMGFTYRDTVVNCACRGWKDGDDNPFEIAESNIILPMLLNKRRNGAGMIHLSSGIEEVQPRHPYAMTKGVASWMLSGIAHVLYLYTVWGGKHVQMTRYMSSLFEACKDNKPYTIVTPNHTRDFVHIDTLCGLIESLLGDREYKIMQVGSGKARSFHTAFERLREVTGRQFPNVRVDYSDNSEGLYYALHPCLPDTFDEDLAKEWKAIHA